MYDVSIDNVTTIPRRRPQHPGYYHVISRGAGGAVLFRDDADRSALLSYVHSTARRYDWVVHAYCLMTTHYHLVLQTRHPNLGAGMQRLNSGYVLRFNQRWARFGTLVSERYRSRWIEGDEYLSEVCRYVFVNPIRAGLCEHVAQWPWSGGRLFAAALAELEASPVAVSLAESIGQVLWSPSDVRG
jgi:REP element-mobilizing transposase RayT